MTSPRSKLSALGAGAITRIILPKLEPHGVSVPGTLDVSAEAARALVEDTPCARLAARIEEVLGDPATDGVYIPTPLSSHKDLIARCLAAGKPVVCEKPWSLNEADARAIDAGVCAGAPGIAVASCSSRFRFAPALRAVLPVLAGHPRGAAGEFRRGAGSPGGGRFRSGFANPGASGPRRGPRLRSRKPSGANWLMR